MFNQSNHESRQVGLTRLASILTSLALIGLLLFASGCTLSVLGPVGPVPLNPPVQPVDRNVPTAAPAPSATPAPSAAPAATEMPAATAVPTLVPEVKKSDQPFVQSAEDASQATVLIVADGKFSYPDGTVPESWGGSGFIIDSSGLAVTNNHVVTGAARLLVFVGKEDKPRHAKVVAVSECADLALIQIDPLEDKPFVKFRWYNRAPMPGLEVYAAGYPLADPEFTLTRGIVSKAQAAGDTDWASVAGVIETDVTLNPGNSGGPLVTKDGEVVGVNYASSSKTRQSFAISSGEAQKVVKQLQQGRDLDSLGLNAMAVAGKSISGLWIFSVKPGSPADKAGVRGGDMVLELEGATLAKDGTMSAYCDILRSHNVGDTLNVSVFRLSDKTLYEGQVNGRPLAPVSSAADPTASPATVKPTTGQATTAVQFTDVADSKGAITLRVPSTWKSGWETAWVLDGTRVGTTFGTAENQQATSRLSGRGMVVSATRSLPQKYNPAVLLDRNSYKGLCDQKVGRDNYTGTGLTGLIEQWSGCGPAKTAVVVQIAASDTTKGYTVLAVIVLDASDDASLLGSLRLSVDPTKLPRS